MFPRCCLSLPGHPEHLFNHWFSCGSSPSQRQAKRLLGQIVDRCRNGPGFHNETDGNSTIQEILIPASKVGLVIGKGGETIKQLQVRDSWPSSAPGGLHFLHLPAGRFCHGSGLPELGWLCATVQRSPQNLCPGASTVLNIHCARLDASCETKAWGAPERAASPVAVKPC